jgi:hypothetical protein
MAVQDGQGLLFKAMKLSLQQLRCKDQEICWLVDKPLAKCISNTYKSVSTHYLLRYLFYYIASITGLYKAEGEMVNDEM